VSTRLVLIGINLEKLKSVFGCKNPEVAENLKGKYDEFYDHSKEELLKAHRLINNIVMGKTTPEEAEENDIFPFLLKNILIWHDQDVIAADGDRWDTFVGYLTEAKRKLGGKAGELENIFLAGRALFTEHNKLPHMEFPYAYLKHEELEELLDYMKKHKEAFYDYEGWGKVFPEFLERVYQAGADLFYFAS